MTVHYIMTWSYSLMGLGGWSILNIWLSDSKKAQNVALLIQLMQVDWMMTIIHTHYDTVCTGINAVTGDPRVFETG